MILSKTHAGTPALVLRDAVATDTGYDNSPGSDQSPICVLLVHPSGIEGLIVLARGPRYSASGFPA